MRRYGSIIAVLLLCAGIFCLAQSRAQVPTTGAGATKPSSGGTVNNMTIDSVQSACPSSASPTIAFSTSQTNDVLVLFIQPGNAGQTVTSITQSGLATNWTQRTLTASGSNNLYEYYAVSSGTIASTSPTISLSASAFAIMELIAIHGANTSSPFDPNGALPYHSTTSNDALVTTTNNATLPIAAYLTGSTSTPSAGSGFTGVSTASCFGIAEYKTSFPTTPQSSLDMTLTTGAGLQTVGIGDAITQ